jgi:RimJ/RimL family protein N-acetyltransferase
MAEARDAVREVRLRPIEDQDLGVFFEHQADPEANEMAAFPARGKDQFAAHWARVRAADTSVLRTIVADGTVAGYITSWEQDGQRLIAYWVGREHWGHGVATQALAQFTRQVTTRPLHAHVWRSAPSGGIGCGRRRRLHRTTASRSSFSYCARRPAGIREQAA